MPIVNNTYCQTFYKDSGTPVDASIQFCAGGQVVEHDSFTGKSLFEALLFAEHGENMLCTEIVLNVKNNFCTQQVLPMFCKEKSF